MFASYVYTHGICSDYPGPEEEEAGRGCGPCILPAAENVLLFWIRASHLLDFLELAVFTMVVGMVGSVLLSSNLHAQWVASERVRRQISLCISRLPLHSAETSNRGTTRQRASIKRKAAETRKKNKKHAKKDVTWTTSMFKSPWKTANGADVGQEKTKDIGIPNNFPYKEQVLAEMAEQKRLVRITFSLMARADGYIGG